MSRTIQAILNLSALGAMAYGVYLADARGIAVVLAAGFWFLKPEGR